MTTYSKLLLKNNKVQLRNGKALAKGRGLYTPAEITDMINNDNYIPVASASELDNLRNTTSQTMGAGTDWEGTYTTGLDKKYVQVRDIDLNNTFSQYATDFSGVYDGNSMNIDNTSRLFLSNSGTIKNINLTRVITYKNSTDTWGLFCDTNNGTIQNIIIFANVDTFPGGGRKYAILCGVNNGSIINCITNGSLNFSSSTQDVESAGICSQNYGEISYCTNNASVDIRSGDRTAGGIVGYNDTTGSIINCTNYGNIYVHQIYAGGISGRSTGNIINCKNYGDISAPVAYAGGIVGLMTGLVSNCISFGNIVSVSLPSYAAGLVGRKDGGSVINSFAACAGTGSGLVGLNSGTITNSYYDKDTSGNSDTGKGEPRTTKQLQNGTADSFINPDGSVDLTQSSANAMFTAWDNAIWKFNPNNKYPRLR